MKDLKQIFQSATRIALMLSIGVVALSYLLIVVCNIHDQQVILGVKENGGSIFLLIIGFYFGQKPLNREERPSSSSTSAISE